MKISVTCSGKKVDIVCKGSPFNCCHSSAAPGSTAACANVKPGPKCSWKKWSCPDSWTTGAKAPDDAKDAKAMIAATNIYRCMHDVIPVRWDGDVHQHALTWAKTTGETMAHSQTKSQGGPRKDSDGENVAGTFKFSKKPGVDATHMWYEEIKKDCHYKKSCYQTFTPGHFTALMWSSVDRIAYADPTGKMAVEQLRGCDDKPPNFNNQFKEMVHPPVKNWETCATEVLKCATFKGLTEDDVEGCDSSSISDGTTWSMKYAQKCKAKYADIMSKLVDRLDDETIPQVFPPSIANAGLVGLAVGLVLVGALALAVRRRSNDARGLEPAPLIDTEKPESEGLE
jgi:hypothetical protein